MSAAEATLLMLAGIPFFVAALIALISLGVLIAATVYAFAKPYIQHLIDAYVAWFDRRVDL